MIHDMKKAYIKPAFETIELTTTGMLAISGEHSGWGEQLAPSMMDIPEEESHSEHEEP